MKRLSDWLYSHITKKVLIISVLVFVCFTAIANPLASNYMDKMTGGAPSPDTSFFYKTGGLFEMAETYGEQGRRAYIIMRFTFDLAFPLIYLFFLAASITKLLSYLPEKARLRRLNLVPFLAVFFDLLENILVAAVMGRYPEKAIAAAAAAPYASALKWLFVILSFLMAAVLGIFRLISFVKSKKAG